MGKAFLKLRKNIYKKINPMKMWKSETSVEISSKH